MKRKLLFTILICVICMMSASCESPYEAKREYCLSRLFLGENELAVNDVYPEGGSFSIGYEGKGKLRLGQQECDVMFSGEGENITILINGAAAEGTLNENEVSFSLEGTDLIYFFSASQRSDDSDQQYEVEVTDLQKQWNGAWDGFVIFSDTDGKWDYLESSIMHVSGSVAVDSEGDGAILLYSSAFSDTDPAIALNINVKEYKEYKVRQTSGYFFDFVCEEGDVDITLQQKDKKELFTTEFIHPEEYNWYIPDLNVMPPENETETADVINISGKCVDEEGGFKYFLDLSRTDSIS